jgi:aminopeptidase N
VNLQALPTPTPAQFATGQKAAAELQTFIPTFFTAANKPPAASEADWTQARGTMEKVAKDTVMFIATKPGTDAMNKYATSKDPKDCVTAEASYRKALEQFADSPAIAYQLGRALRCQQAASPEKVPQAIYEFARAAAIDPTLGGTMDAKALQTYLENAYSGFHGGLDGLDQLKQQAKSSPLPPAGLTIETASAIAAATGSGTAAGSGKNVPIVRTVTSCVA